MKSVLLLSILPFVAVCISLSLLTISSQSMQGKVPPNEKAIKEVKEGKRKVAYASWWGFDPEDATEALQAAIDSGAPKVVVENMGRPWVVSRTINLRSNRRLCLKRASSLRLKRALSWVEVIVSSLRRCKRT